MNNEIDLLDELDREERDERLAAGGGGAGAALGVFLTLLIGCGLVFSAYKLGQRKNVDEPPLIAAVDGPVKIAPENPGGAEIPNTDNVANAMIDGSRPSVADNAAPDGVTVEANLPPRDIDPAATVEAREIRREIVDLSDLAMKSTLEGEPSLQEEGAPDRSDEHLLADGAEVAPSDRPVEDVVASANGEGTLESVDVASASGTSPDSLPTDRSHDGGDVFTEVALGEAQPGSVNTVIATDETGQPLVETADAFGEGTSVPFPVQKPNVGPSAGRRIAEANIPTQPALAPQTRDPGQSVRRPVDPAVASRINPNPPQPTPQFTRPAPRVPSPSGVLQAAIPPQPVGDAQVQLGAFPDANEVRGRWARLRSQHRDILGPLGLQVLPVVANDGRQLFRMRVGPLRDGRMAAQLCEALRGRGVDCFVPAR